MELEGQPIDTLKRTPPTWPPEPTANTLPKVGGIKRVPSRLHSQGAGKEPLQPKGTPEGNPCPHRRIQRTGNGNYKVTISSLVLLLECLSKATVWS